MNVGSSFTWRSLGSLLALGVLRILTTGCFRNYSTYSRPPLADEYISQGAEYARQGEYERALEAYGKAAMVIIDGGSGHHADLSLVNGLEADISEKIGDKEIVSPGPDKSIHHRTLFFC